MEAIAQWDFEASQQDELSFKKGSRLCIISGDDGGWVKAVNGQISGFVPSAYIKEEPHDWYKDSMTRGEAELYLLQTDTRNSFIFHDGAYIVRKSDKNGFALSVKHGDTVQHFKILTDSNNKFYIWPNSIFFSINQLVAKYHQENVSGDPKKVIILKDIQLEYYEAMYDFVPETDEEIELKKGDIIRIISKSDQNWWEGEVRGKKGYFPQNYVRERK